MKLTIKNSVYNTTVGSGLSVQGGRLINDRPNSQMGIVSAANARKEMKRENKIQMQAEAYVRGERRSEINEMMSGMSPGCD